MNRSSLLVVFVFVGIGCGKTTPAVAPKPAPAVVVMPPQVVQLPQQPVVAMKVEPPKADEPSKEDRKILVLKEKVAAYLSEARAGAKLLSLDPSLEQLKETSKLITDLYTHLPDVPADLDPKGHVATRLKQINGTFAIVIDITKLRIQAEKLIVDSEKLLEVVIEQKKAIEGAANNLNQFANEIESELGL